MKKRICLIYPPISKLERYSSPIGAAGGEQIPLGIYYLASYLREKNYEVLVIDAETDNLDSSMIIRMLTDFDTEFIGISSTTVAFHRALELANEIKSQMLDTVIILGGPHITSNVDHAMSFECFDYGVLKEGEISLHDLLETLIANESVDKIKGIAYRNEMRDLVVNPEREYIKDLDSLPFPAYDMIGNIIKYTPPPSNYRALPVINIITSRGCPNRCTFCDRNVFGEKYRERSAQNVFAEIDYLYKKYGIKEIAFVDDTFLINKKRTYELFELLDQNNIRLYWTCLSRINTVDYDYLKFIKAKGCWHISFGIESGDEDILKLINKNITLDRAVQVIKWCKELDIKTKGFFMIGHPGETLETINKTIAFACKLDLDDVVVTINTPIPGTTQYKEIEKYGRLDQTDWSKYNYWRPVFVPFGLSEGLLLRKHKEFYWRFYVRPRIIWRYFKSFFGSGGLKRLKTLISASKFLIPFYSKKTI